MVTQRPNYIPLPSQVLSFDNIHDDDDDDDELFHTAPSTPDLFHTPPTSPLLPSPPPSHDDSPPSVDLAIDLALNDESLSNLEKIYLFSRSKSIFHRVFIAHALPSFLDEVSPQEANEYVLPLLTGLATDDEEQVKEALAAELVPIIWWFFTHCKVIPDDIGEDPLTLTEVTISVQAFTPILGTLLLSPNPHVGETARYAVVDLLDRIRKADDQDARTSFQHDSSSTKRADDDYDNDFAIGLFGPLERSMFQEEILQQVVIGISYLDVHSIDGEASTVGDDKERSFPFENGSIPELSQVSQDCSVKDEINPYFPHSPLSSPEAKKTIFHSSENPPEFLSPSNTLFVAECIPDHGDALLSPFTSQSQPPVLAVQSLDTASRSSLLHLNPPQQGRLSPDLIDAVPSSSVGERSACGKDDMEYDIARDRVLGPSWNCTCDDPCNHDDCEDQKAAVGRLSSMSLMAAVTASGFLAEDTMQAFVKEVERVGRDPIPWVRTEASFALGALAKVVPEEVLQCSLIPLFDRLRGDSAWRVRHSAVFALPAILARLRPLERRKLSLDTVVGLAADESATVRLGVLEVLGEVLYTFHADEDGIPEDLLNLFLGKEIDRDAYQTLSSPNPDRNLHSFFQEARRPLICAFNFPAVAFAIGGERWKDVRDTYLSLSTDTDFRVRRTLAASLGELANIIGEDQARRDLIQVWWDAIKSDSEETRLKALEALVAFTGALGRPAGTKIIEGILTVWDEGILKTWRERDCVAKSLEELCRWGHQDIPFVIYGLLQRSLEDNVAAVRESAAAGLPRIRKILSNQPNVLSNLHNYLLMLAGHTTYRRRMTFIACQQSLVSDGEDRTIFHDDILNVIAQLANDRVDGVRIGIARLVRVICEKHGSPINDTLLSVINRLSHDNCYDVRAYVAGLTKFSQNREYNFSGKTRILNIFSRPPSRLTPNPTKMKLV